MEKTEICDPFHLIQAKDQETNHDEFKESISHNQDIIKENTWVSSLLYEINGCWIPAKLVPAVTNFQNQFQAKDSDIMLATMPKSGTTWLKALVFTITNRNLFQTLDQSPLLSSNPHALVPFFEYDIYPSSNTPLMNVDEIPSPRIFSTHIHFQCLPASVLDTKCRIIYIYRDPLDQFVSHWCFALENFYDGKTKPPIIEEALEKYSKGIHPFGPFWDHMLGYSKASSKDSNKVLFLKYEVLKADPVSVVKKIAEFLEIPFSPEEEINGMVEEVVKLCSFDNLKNLEVNRNGRTNYGVKHSSFFRKGGIGDWVNYVPPTMAELVLNVMEEKLGGAGISF
ncbi:transferase [Lithospermum erythrorhizon]|uniref:Sulfotransferase n=1 Tax=Lithospermum erythrorhizon TaxID=34254 RepID=A0AAV3PL32_LITER